MWLNRFYDFSQIIKFGPRTVKLESKNRNVDLQGLGVFFNYLFKNHTSIQEMSKTTLKSFPNYHILWDTHY